MDFRIYKKPTSLVLALQLYTFFLFTLSFNTAKAFEVRYVPAYCDPSALSLLVKNKTAEPQRFWTQVRLENELKEIFFELPAHENLEIPGNEIVSEKMAFSVKALEKKSVEISTTCKGMMKVPVSDLTTPKVTHYFPKKVKKISLYLLNLYLNKNSIALTAFDKKGQVIDHKEIQLQKYYDTEYLKWSFAEDVEKIEVSGAERLNTSAFYSAIDEEKLSPAMALEPVRFPLNNTKTYFLVSTKNNPEEAFVIAIDDPQKIATAREQIKTPSLEKIIVAGITLGNGGFNRAFLSKDKSPYSWSVTSVDAFADFAHIDCDGSPDIVEERLMERLNSGGSICFWRYRVVRELSPQEVSSGKLNKR
ncbi:MAG: BP74-related protein [Bdellovibrio sp.]